MAACHRWWLVVGDEAIVQPGELPTGWGLLVPKAGALKCKVEPTRREAAFGLPFLAALCRRVHQTTVPKRDIADKLKGEYERGRALGKMDADSIEREFKYLRDRVAAFDKASGLDILHGWENAEKVGHAVQQVLRHGPEEIRTRLEYFRKSVLGIVEQIDAQLAEDDAHRSGASPEATVSSSLTPSPATARDADGGAEMDGGPAARETPR